MTIPHTECLDIVANVFIEKKPMNMPREGHSACIFDIPSQIYVFGGMNMENERLDSIEQYDIQKDSWTVLDIKLSHSLAQNICHALGKDRVLILGCTPEQIQNPKTFDYHTKWTPHLQVIDLSAQMHFVDIYSQVESIFMPSFLDQNGILHMFKGTADNEPEVLKLNIGPIINLKVPPTQFNAVNLGGKGSVSHKVLPQTPKLVE